MKRIMIYFVTIFVISGCKKESDTPSAEFSFLADGVTYTFKGDAVFPYTGSMIQNTSRYLVVYKKGFYFSGSSYPSYLSTTIESTTLKIQTYDVEFEFSVNNKLYNEMALYTSHFNNGTITFTKIENDRASGIFTAIIDSTDKITQKPTGRKVVISEGRFSNVKILN